MILTRIKRGATRSLLLVKHNLNSNQLQRSRFTWRAARTIFLNALVVRTIVLPIPLAAPASAEASLVGEDTTEPPSIVRISSEATHALTIANNDPVTLTVQGTALQSVTVGESIATEQEQQAAAQAQAAAAQAAAQAEAAHAAALAAQKKAAQAVRVLAAVPALAPIDPGSIQDLAHQMTVARFGESQWPAMVNLIEHESGFNPLALNRSSGACGIPQALPCSKLPEGINTPPAGQIAWMLNYVAARYGSPASAWVFWLAHGHY